MDLIRVSTFITTLIHCVLAHSLPQIDYLAQNPGSYDFVSPVPGSGILQTPYDNIPEVEKKTTVVNPSWQNRSSLDNSDVVRKDEANNNQPLSHKAEGPSTPLKGIGLKYPLTMPKSAVKLSFIGQSGMLPVKNVQNTPTPIPELPSKVLKSTSSELPTTPGSNERLVGRVPLYKNIQTPTEPENLDQASKLVLNPSSLYPPTSPSSIGQELPSNAFQYTPSSKPELPGLILNPTNPGYPPTNQGIVYGNDEADYSGIEGLKSTNFEYPTYRGVHGFSIEKAVKYTPSYKTYVPEISVSKLTNLGYPSKKSQYPLEAIQHTPSYLSDLSAGVLKATNLDYFPTKPVGKDENTAAIKLPPVPSTMPLLRRIQLALMNTVAGLPGGNPQALDSIRAR